MIDNDLKCPFPYFGGKSQIADKVWEMFGDVKRYIEPFFGTGAVLFARPKTTGGARVEIVNDKSCFLANFWRAIKSNPDEVAYYADNPVNHADLCARRNVLLLSARDLHVNCMTDDTYYDAKLAGYWVWYASTCIALDLTERRIEQCERERFRDCPVPSLASKHGVNTRHDLVDWFQRIADRLRDVHVVCGDYTRVLGGGNWRTAGGTCGIFLDPPYSKNCDSSSLYGHDCGGVAAAVRKFCIENGGKPMTKIMLCGYADEHDELLDHGWGRFEWTAQGGYANHSQVGNNNRFTETIWISPEINKDKSQMTLF